MHISTKLTLLSAAILLAACNTAPKTTTLLEQTRAEYRSAKNDVQVNQYAPAELSQSAEALDKADAAATKRDSDEKIDQLAYLARQKVTIAEDVAKQKAAEASIAAAGKKRDQVQLNERTQEANAANASAAMANQTALAAQIDARQAQDDTRQAQEKAARLEQELRDLNAKKTDHGIIITFGDILFNTDQSHLNPSGVGVVQKLAQILIENPQRNVLIGGFTDSTGTAAYNLELSERRAQAVSDVLTGMNVARTRITLQGFGETHPIADNKTAQNRQLNRRVEITLSDASGTVSAVQ